MCEPFSGGHHNLKLKNQYKCITYLLAFHVFYLFQEQLLFILFISGPT